MTALETGCIFRKVFIFALSNNGRCRGVAAASPRHQVKRLGHRPSGTPSQVGIAAEFERLRVCGP